MSGGAPFGLRRQDGRLVPHTVEAAIVRELVEAFLASGGRMKAAAAAMNSKGYRTRQGSPWSHTAVSRVLRAVAEVGIVPEELRHRCVALLEERSQGSGGLARRPAHYLGGVIHCGGNCGGRRYLEGTGAAGKFICRGCRAKIPVESLERLFVESLRSVELTADEVFGALADNPRAGELTRMLGGAPVPVAKVWSVLDASEKRVVVDVAVSRIVVDQDQITVVYACEPDSARESGVCPLLALPSSYDPEGVPDKATHSEADVCRPERPARRNGSPLPPTSSKDLPMLLTVEAAAEVLHTSPKAVYTMVDRGILPGVVRVGRRILIRRDEMLDSLDESRASSPKEDRR